MNRDLGTSNDERRKSAGVFPASQAFQPAWHHAAELDDIDDDDLDKVAEARLIVEMHKTRAAMDEVLDAEWKLRGEKRPVVRW